MNSNRAIALAVALSCILPTAVYGDSHLDLMPTELLVRGLRADLSRSPDDYLAAVVEVATLPDCPEEDESVPCTQHALVREVLSSAAASPSVGDTIQIYGRGPIGSKYVAFLVPSDHFDKVYRATYLSVTDSDEVRSQLKKAVEKAME